ncbi:hypothetical protein M3678_12770, partial [Staphylococcus capitis]|nr:hypothetical protein [Staphylococcus capitis]
RMEFNSGLGFMVSVDQQGLEITAEAAAVLVSASRGRRGTRHRFAVQAFVEDALDGAVLRAAERERTLAGCFQPLIADFLSQPDDPLRRAG